jgi:hypothetical protein
MFILTKQVLILLMIIPGVIISCSTAAKKNERGANNFATDTIKSHNLNVNRETLQQRFIPPSGYQRTQQEPQSFAEYLRKLPLKPLGSKVHYYNGEIKTNNVYEAVVDMEITARDLQQCADACMRLRGEYLYSKKAYGQISFTLTNGFKVDYAEWIKGNRVIVNGNQTFWRKIKEPSNTYKDFRAYMDFIFAYAGTISLSKEMISKNIKDIAIGDVFVVSGSPGHAVMVVDLAVNKSGEKVFMLAQSYMPAQETQILKNMQDPGMSPWYSTKGLDKLYTPEWTFELTQLKGWVIESN